MERKNEMIHKHIDKGLQSLMYGPVNDSHECLLPMNVYHKTLLKYDI